MAPQKHSSMGIASFIISIAVGLLMLATLAVAGVAATTTPAGMDEKSTLAMGVGMVMLGLLFLSLVACGLGIAIVVGSTMA
jgi:hypothetical protein